MRDSTLQSAQTLTLILNNFSGRMNRYNNQTSWDKHPSAEESPYLIKNKSDEEAIFGFLNDAETMNSWMHRRKPRRSETIKKKEVYRIIGTPDYMAPEILAGKDCSNKSIDLWSLGVILYEFLVGVPPFNDDTVDKIFANILDLKLEWPTIGYEEDCLSPEAYDLITKLMDKDPIKRLDIQGIKKHDFFKSIDILMNFFLVTV